MHLGRVTLEIDRHGGGARVGGGDGRREGSGQDRGTKERGGCASERGFHGVFLVSWAA